MDASGPGWLIELYDRAYPKAADWSMRKNLNDMKRVSNTPKWYFQIEMRPGHRPEGAGQHSDSFWVFIDLGGQAGKIQAHQEP